MAKIKTTKSFSKKHTHATYKIKRLKAHSIRRLHDDEESSVKLVPVFKTSQQERSFAKAAEKHRTSGAKLEW